MDRASIKTLYRGFYTEIEEILFRNDPMGINFVDNTDEYDPEVDTILPRLKTANSESDVLDIVHEEFCKWFDADMVGKKSHPVYKVIAKEVWSAWLKFSRPID